MPPTLPTLILRTAAMLIPSTALHALIISPIPEGATTHDSDFLVEARANGGEWQTVPCYGAKVDYHAPSFEPVAWVQSASEVEFRVTPTDNNFSSVKLRPAQKKFPHEVKDGQIHFKLSPPEKLVLQLNGHPNKGLHLFVDLPDKDVPDPKKPGVIYFGPGLHDHTTDPRIERSKADGRPDRSILRVGSDTTVYLAAGAVLRAAIIIEDKARNVTIRGRGIVDLLAENSANGDGGPANGSTTARGVQARFSESITIRDILFLNPPHYTVYLGQTNKVHIDNIKSFSFMQWSDGIDMMSSSDVLIENVFMRNSDDCIAIYGHRWNYFGDAKNIVVKNSILWADKAHAYFVGTHGDYAQGGNIIEGLVLENIDILEHDEPFVDYQGAVALNANDGNIIRDVLIKDVRVEHIIQGKVFDLRVFFIKDYGHYTPDGKPIAGRAIENVRIVNLNYSGQEDRPSVIEGYSDTAQVKDVLIEGMTYQGKEVRSAKDGNIKIGPHTDNIRFRSSILP